MKAVVAAFNQEKALVGAFSVITNLQKELFGALINTLTALLFTSSVMSAALLSLLLCLSKLQIISVFSPLPFVQNFANFQEYFFLLSTGKLATETITVFW